MRRLKSYPLAKIIGTGLATIGLIGAVVFGSLILQSNVLIGLLDSPLSFIGSCLFTWSLLWLYLDDFKLSNIKFAKNIQTFSFTCIPLYTIYLAYSMYDILDFLHIKDDKNIHLHGHVSLDKDTYPKSSYVIL